MLVKPALLLAAFGIPNALGAHPSRAEKAKYVDWKSFKAYGVNLGGWLVQESNIDTLWWDKYSGRAENEWGLREYLGSQLLEQRYASWITTSDIDKAAKSGITLLRIPTTYAAWIKFPGSKLYSGNQAAYLKKIATYAIARYGMRIILDVHGLPGGINGLTIGEAAGHWGWFNNQTNFDYSMQVMDTVIDFIQSSGHPESYTLEPMKEPADNHDLSVFGTSAALSDIGAAWVLKYIHAVLDRVTAVNPKIPVMFQGSFKGEKYWSGNFSSSDNLVFDVHNYYFAARNTTSSNIPSYICTDAKVNPGDRKFPVFLGEWSIQAPYNNTFASRERNLNYGLDTFHRYSHGFSYWTWKFSGNATIDGQGTQADY
ncbi:hypothetical protein N7520_000507 [Penicillium odoratum]|uniref:uncharacterized protein n=1 Tax=Penicillium odoratum TaxID=1167516 RepID=UPI002548606C|nr:uncharacterized protein N7520_000507 [Penicillium odoratum]KAJ5777261.1 hypothetical protein N7520_000507 [Penicillium odoratum]